MPTWEIWTLTENHLRRLSPDVLLTSTWTRTRPITSTTPAQPCGAARHVPNTPERELLSERCDPANTEALMGLLLHVKSGIKCHCFFSLQSAEQRQIECLTRSHYGMFCCTSSVCVCVCVCVCVSISSTCRQRCRCRWCDLGASHWNKTR